MNTEASQLMDDQSSIYLEDLRALISEMNEGMNAIATNSVAALRDSVAKQEFLCAHLAASGIADGARLKQMSQSRRPLSEAAIEMTIWKESHTIRQLNLQYAALLKHSGRTITLLSSLCDSHTGSSNEPFGSLSKKQTWSCEI